MKKKLETDLVIESLVIATLDRDATARQKYLYRESLRNLVRLAKSEQIRDIKMDVAKLTGMLGAHSAKKRAKAMRFARRLPGIFQGGQQQFEFN